MNLVIEGIYKKFDQKILFNDASFEFEKGKIYGLLGRNGAGKTTLFNCIAQNISLDEGSISLREGEKIESDYQEDAIGFVYTQPHLPGFMTAVEFIRFYLDMNKERIQDMKSPTEYLTEIGIQEVDQNRLLKDFSHGMQNKVQMLVTILVQPPVLLLDEPLTSFDVVAAHEMKEMILKAKKNSVVIFSTHILQLAQDLCDEIVLLHQQKLQGIPADKIHDADFENEVVELLSVEENAVEVDPVEEKNREKGVGSKWRNSND